MLIKVLEYNIWVSITVFTYNVKPKTNGRFKDWGQKSIRSWSKIYLLCLLNLLDGKYRTFLQLMSKESMAQFGTEPQGDIEAQVEDLSGWSYGKRYIAWNVFDKFIKCCVWWQLKKALEDLSVLMAEKDELAQRCQELDIQVSHLSTGTVLLQRHLHLYGKNF